MAKIERIDTAHLLFEYERGFRYAGGRCTARMTSLAFVHTADGRCGVGAAYSHPGMVELTIKGQLEPILIGMDPSDPERLWELMYRLTRWYGRKGAAISSIGAVDTALWDLKGQELGKPLHALFGAASSCPAYASALLWDAPENLAAEAKAHVAAGFTRMKTRLGRSPAEDERVVQAIGPACDLLVDGSMRYTVASAKRIAAMLEAHDVFWFEEPFEPEELDRYCELRAQVDVPLAAGENEFGSQGFGELMHRRAVDIVQPDASRCGGVTELRRIVAAAERNGLRAATHTWSDAVAILANAHVIGPAANGVTVEIDRTGNPFVDELLEQPLEIENGKLILPSTPGLGANVRPDILEQFRLDPFAIPPGLYSDMAFGAGSLQPAPPYPHDEA
ncbi:MAG: mandelate racemase/muconate lactonizing enzyme family protein [Pirellulaceae bacterium]|jgi:L-alanine-DL-glutamate epimerase-like enolase superfamily enzyme|nr:mandelate racemase/muconate lactonizing enzyme family protein [Pirellulaceae bacterium]